MFAGRMTSAILRTPVELNISLYILKLPWNRQTIKERVQHVFLSMKCFNLASVQKIMKNYSALGVRVLAPRKVEIKFQPVSKKLLSESLKIQLFQTPATVSAHRIPSLFTDSVKRKRPIILS